MTASLLASIEVLDEVTVGRPMRMRLRLTSAADDPARVVSPDLGDPPPELGWTASGDTYRFALLISLGLVRLSMRDSDGMDVVSKQPMPWVDPLVGSRYLAHDESVVFEFDLDAFFMVERPGRYVVTIDYVDAKAPAQAMVELDIKPIDTEPMA